MACLTTCVPGFEAETVACCTTGDNRLCLNLPFTLLNSSIGSCQGSVAIVMCKKENMLFGPFANFRIVHKHLAKNRCSIS